MKGGSNLFIVFLLLTALQVSCMPGIYCETTLKDSTYFVYGKDNKPVVFSNIVSYRSEGETHRVEHESYTSCVTNLTKAKALKDLCPDELGNKLYVSNNAFALVGSIRFTKNM